MKFDLTQANDILARTPVMLSAWLTGIDDRWAHANEGPDTFSPFEVVGHLIDGEETDWLSRAEIILKNRDAPLFEPYDRFRHRERNVGRSLDSLLIEFASLRADNLKLLSSWQLGPKELELPGEHPLFGAVSLRQLLSAWVVHDLGHIAQVARVMAKQYREEAGPWLPFMPVLSDRPKPVS